MVCLTVQQDGNAFVGKTGMIGVGFNQVTDYQTNILLEQPTIIDQKILYDASDVAPIVTGGTYSF